MKTCTVYWKKLIDVLNKSIAKLAVLCLQFYRYFISPYLGRRCRFEPSCSVYAIEAFSTFSALKASYLVVKRLSKCHPFGPYGYDPVPQAEGRCLTCH